MTAPETVPVDAYVRAVEAMKAYEELFNVPAAQAPERLIRAGALGVAVSRDIHRIGCGGCVAELPSGVQRLLPPNQIFSANPILNQHVDGAAKAGHKCTE